jgi:hypothetical protein
MQQWRVTPALAGMCLAFAVSAEGQTPAVPAEGPTVAMTVTTPDGRTQELSTHESGLATLEVSGHKYGFRPTMYDDEGKKMTITIFDMGGAGQPIHQLAAVDVTGGSAPVSSQSTPAFKVKAAKSNAPLSPPTAQSTKR